MTKKQAQNRENIINQLSNQGITRTDAETLIRAEMTLHRWAERECNGELERDDETGKPYVVNTRTMRRYPTSDREAGAIRRINAITSLAGLAYYHQTDPRGAALYILRPGDVPEGCNAESYYSRGLCICGR